MNETGRCESESLFEGANCLEVYVDTLSGWGCDWIIDSDRMIRMTHTEFKISVDYTFQLASSKTIRTVLIVNRDKALSATQRIWVSRISVGNDSDPMLNPACNIRSHRWWMVRMPYRPYRHYLQHSQNNFSKRRLFNLSY